MNNIYKRILSTCSLVLLSCFACFAQSGSKASIRQDNSLASDVMGGTGKTAVIVVGSAAKVAWKTTKFTGKYVVKPVAVSVLKPLFVKGAPHAAGFVLKKTAKYLLPLAVKLSVL